MSVVPVVYRALAAAEENGYRIAAFDIEEVIEDLLQYDSDLCGCTPEEIRPHVLAWVKQHE